MTAGPDQRQTFRRSRRVTRTGDFRAVYAYRARAADQRLVAYVKPNGLAQARLGVSVGRRCGGAVERNRTKRLLREAFRQCAALRPAGHDLVVVALGRDYSLGEVERRLTDLVAEAVRRSRRKQEPPREACP